MNCRAGPDKFVEPAQNEAGIIDLSTPLTTTMPHMESTLKAIQDAGLRNNVKIIIGGAPVTAFFQQIGTDGYEPDASQAATFARDFVD